MLPFREPSATRKLALYPETGHPLSASMLRAIRVQGEVTRRTARIGNHRIGRVGSPSRPPNAVREHRSGRAPTTGLSKSTIIPPHTCLPSSRDALVRRGYVIARRSRGDLLRTCRRVSVECPMLDFISDCSEMRLKRFRHIFYVVRFHCGTEMRTCVGRKSRPVDDSIRRVDRVEGYAPFFSSYSYSVWHFYHRFPGFSGFEETYNPLNPFNPRDRKTRGGNGSHRLQSTRSTRSTRPFRIVP